MDLHIQDGMTECKLHLRSKQTNVWQTLLFFYNATEKYPLECMFVYNFVSPRLSLFLCE